MSENKQGVFVVNIDSYYLRDTQVLNPDGEVEMDPESETFCDDVYENDDNWKDRRVDGYLGVYTWQKDDKAGLLSYVAKKKGLKKETLEAFNILELSDVKTALNMSMMKNRRKKL